MEDTRPKKWALWYEPVLDDDLYHLLTGSYDEVVTYARELFEFRLHIEENHPGGICSDCVESCRNAIGVLKNANDPEFECDVLTIDGDQLCIFPVPPA